MWGTINEPIQRKAFLYSQMYFLFIYYAFKNVNKLSELDGDTVPSDSALAIAHEHTVTQIKNNADVIYLNVAGKVLSELLYIIFYNFVWQTTCLHTTTS